MISATELLKLLNERLDDKHTLRLATSIFYSITGATNANGWSTFRVELSGKPQLASTDKHIYGEGKSIEEAIDNLLKQLAGQTIYFQTLDNEVGKKKFKEKVALGEYDENGVVWMGFPEKDEVTCFYFIVPG